MTHVEKETSTTQQDKQEPDRQSTDECTAVDGSPGIGIPSNIDMDAYETNTI